MPIIVFDFDKTLTYKDTLVDFFEHNGSQKYLYLKNKAAHFLKIISWLGLIKNTRLKKILVWMYLKGMSYDNLIGKSKEFSKNIIFNKIYYEIYLGPSQNEYLVLSASFYEFLQFIVPSENLLASRLLCDSTNKVIGVKSNLYAFDKVKELERQGIFRVDKFYTDSYSDKPVMDISDEVYLVKGDLIERIK